MQNTSPLQILYEPFQLLPSSYDVGPTLVKAFEFTGTTIPYRIDLSCDCVTSITDLEWITFDSQANTLTIETSGNDYIGLHRIFLVQ
jgi:hypothetical protein